MDEQLATDPQFRYKARAVALTAHLRLPYDSVAPPQAIVALPPEGGLADEPVGAFSFHGVVSISSAVSVVAGSIDKRDGGYDSLANTTIEGFDVLGVVTADRIVSRIAAKHPADGGPPSITPLGSHFQNLRIAGHKVDVELATDTFGRWSTFEGVRGAYRANTEGFREEFNELALLGKSGGILERLRSYFPWGGEEAGDEIPADGDGLIRCGLVRKIAGLGSSMERHGHVIYVPGFGVVRLGEFFMTHDARGLTMIEIDLGSTPAGKTSGGTTQSGPIKGHGTGW